MPNGYFLEGFVRFVDPADDGDVVSLPSWTKENSKTFQLLKNQSMVCLREGKDIFIMFKRLNISSANVSALVTLQMTFLTQGKRDGRITKVLGIEEREGT